METAKLRLMSSSPISVRVGSQRVPYQKDVLNRELCPMRDSQTKWPSKSTRLLTSTVPFDSLPLAGNMDPDIAESLASIKVRTICGIAPGSELFVNA